MQSFFNRETLKSFKKIISSFIVLTFLTSLIVSPVGGQVLPILNSPVSLNPAFQPPVLLGLKIHPENPLLFDFIVDQGQTVLSTEKLKSETTKLVKYFLAALTIPDKEVWVNLSPTEKDRIIPDVLGQTTMGKTMLEQDYVLKQLASSLTNPDTDLGKKYWDNVNVNEGSIAVGNRHACSLQNKVWIMPAKAEVLESNGIVLVGEKRLKVMLAEDLTPPSPAYRQAGPLFKKEGERGDTPVTPASLGKQGDILVTPSLDNTRALVTPSLDKEGEGGVLTTNVSSQIFRTTILPAIEKAVNEGKEFADVRQIYNSVILAAWYKKALKESLLGKVYADKGKVAGVETDDKAMKQRIYEQYLAAFKKGAYNLIKEEADESGDLIPRKYFSGGAILNFVGSSALTTKLVRFDDVSARINGVSSSVVVTVKLAEPNSETVFLVSASAVETPMQLYQGITNFLLAKGFGEDMKLLELAGLNLQDMVGSLFSYNTVLSSSDSEELKYRIQVFAYGYEVQAVNRNRSERRKLEPLRKMLQKKIDTVLPGVLNRILAFGNNVENDPQAKEFVSRVAKYHAYRHKINNITVVPRSIPKNPQELINFGYLELGPGTAFIQYASFLAKESKYIAVDNSFFVTEFLKEFARISGIKNWEIIYADIMNFSKPSIALGTIRVKGITAYEERFTPEFLSGMLDWLSEKGQLVLQIDSSISRREKFIKQWGEFVEKKIENGWGFHYELEPPNDSEIESGYVKQLVFDTFILTKPAIGKKFDDRQKWEELQKQMSASSALEQESLSPAEIAQYKEGAGQFDWENASKVLWSELVRDENAQPHPESEKQKNYFQNQKETRAEVLRLIFDYSQGKVLDHDALLNRLKKIHRISMVGISGKSPYDGNQYPGIDDWEAEDQAGNVINYSAVHELVDFINDRMKGFVDKNFQRKSARGKAEYISSFYVELASLPNIFGRVNHSFYMVWINSLLRLSGLNGVRQGWWDIQWRLGEETLVSGKKEMFERIVAANPPIDFGKPLTVSSVLESSQASGAASPLGGIDFDPTNMNLQIKRDGKGVPLPLPQQNLEQINIQGLFPVIINITPINAQTLPIFLGQAPKEPAREIEQVAGT